MSVAALISSLRAEAGVPHAVSCRVLGRSEPWFYKQHNRTPTASELRRRELDGEVAEAFAASAGTYGSPRVAAVLRDAGRRVSTNTVADSMARQGLSARPKRRRRRPSARPGAPPDGVEDRLGRDFSAPAPNVRWCGDFKQIPTAEGPVHLAVVCDLYSRRVVGFATSEDYRTAELAGQALSVAVAQRGGDVAGVVFHTDRGSQYTSREFAATCRRQGVVQSTGRPGSALDNAAVESFFATLQRELLARRHYRTRTEARHDTADWIVDWYNPHRRHSTLNMTSPTNYENNHHPDRRPQPAAAPAA